MVKTFKRELYKALKALKKVKKRFSGIEHSYSSTYINNEIKSIINNEFDETKW